MVHGYAEIWIMGLRIHGKMAIREYGYIGKWMSGHVDNGYMPAQLCGSWK